MIEYYEKNGVVRKVKIGFSWTVLFFGFIALLIRGQYVPALVEFITFGIGKLYYIFTANRLLAEQLKLDGFVKFEPSKETKLKDIQDRKRLQIIVTISIALIICLKLFVTWRLLKLFSFV